MGISFHKQPPPVRTAPAILPCRSERVRASAPPPPPPPHVALELDAITTTTDQSTVFTLPVATASAGDSELERKRQALKDYSNSWVTGKGFLATFSHVQAAAQTACLTFGFGQKLGGVVTECLFNTFKAQMTQSATGADGKFVPIDIQTYLAKQICSVMFGMAFAAALNLANQLLLLPAVQALFSNHIYKRVDLEIIVPEPRKEDFRNLADYRLAVKDAHAARAEMKRKQDEALGLPNLTGAGQIHFATSYATVAATSNGAINGTRLGYWAPYLTSTGASLYGGAGTGMTGAYRCARCSHEYQGTHWPLFTPQQRNPVAADRHWAFRYFGTIPMDIYQNVCKAFDQFFDDRGVLDSLLHLAKQAELRSDAIGHATLATPVLNAAQAMISNAVQNSSILPLMTAPCFAACAIMYAVRRWFHDLPRIQGLQANPDKAFLSHMVQVNVRDAKTMTDALERWQREAVEVLRQPNDPDNQQAIELHLAALENHMVGVKKLHDDIVAFNQRSGNRRGATQVSRTFLQDLNHQSKKLRLLDAQIKAGLLRHNFSVYTDPLPDVYDDMGGIVPAHLPPAMPTPRLVRSTAGNEGAAPIGDTRSDASADGPQIINMRF